MKRKKLLLGATILCLCLTACSKNHKSEETQNTVTETIDQKGDYYGSVILTVNGVEVTYDEVLVYLQSKKEQIEGMYGPDVWTMKLDEGKTYEDVMKESVLDEIIYLKLVCSKADEFNISLSEDELLDVQEYTDEFMQNFDDTSRIKYHLDEQLIRNIYKDNIIANKVYEYLTLNVDTDVTEEEAMQATFQYIMIGKHGVDIEGNRYEYTSEQLKEAKDKAEKLQKEALTTSDFYNLALANSDDEDEVEITVGKGDMKEELTQGAFSLKEGEVSSVIETQEGYFIFKCINAYNQKATDAKKEEIIRQRQKDSFDQKYEEWSKEKKVDIKESVWNQISIKNIIVQ